MRVVLQVWLANVSIRPETAGDAERGTLVVLAVVAISLCASRSEAAPTDRSADPAAMVENGRIAFVSSWAENLAAEIFRVDVGSGRRTNLSRNPAADNWAVVAPDGRTILFQSSRDNVGAIWAMTADGTQQRRLTTVRARPGRRTEAGSPSRAARRTSWSCPPTAPTNA